MKLYTHNQILDETIGREGSPKREKFDSDMQDFLIGETIKRTRLRLHLTQRELGERMGVQESRVSKMESGKNLNYSAIVRAFKAMGAETATLDLGNLGKVPLW